MNKTDLLECLPCPFCGSAARHGWRGYNRTVNQSCGFWFCGCPKCRMLFLGTCPKDVITQWNTRLKKPLQPDENHHWEAG